MSAKKYSYFFNIVMMFILDAIHALNNLIHIVSWPYRHFIYSMDNHYFFSYITLYTMKLLNQNKIPNLFYTKKVMIT